MKHVGRAERIVGVPLLDSINLKIYSVHANDIT